jgi:hypothetical protein
LGVVCLFDLLLSLKHLLFCKTIEGRIGTTCFPTKNCEFIIPCLDLGSGWSLKQTCSSPQELSNSVLQSIYTHRGWVDSQLLVVGSQTASLTPGPSFRNNLCCRCPNGSCEAIFDIYTLIVFQWYEECFKARCFDPCNRTPEGLPSPHCGSVSVILTFFQKWGCDILCDTPLFENAEWLIKFLCLVDGFMNE